MNEKIAKKTLADEVAARLQEQLSLGHYKAGEKLPIEPELMKSYGVGRSTIREAIKILINAGWLRVQQGLGTFVEDAAGNKEPMEQRLQRANIKDLDEVRRLLEMKIAEKAAINRKEKDIRAIRRHLEERKIAALAGQLEACIEADIRFHTAIAEASGNEILADFYKSASAHLKKKWFLQLYKSTEVFKRTQALHEQLLKDIVLKDDRKAWNTASKIISNM